MPSSTMWTTVLQTTAIYIVSLLVTHHASENIFSDVINDPGFSNWTAAIMNSSYSINDTHDASSDIAVNQSTSASLSTDILSDKGSNASSVTIAITNSTTLNETLSAVENKPESFYKKVLPIDVFAYLILCTLQYCWLLWLERILPARPRRRDVLVEEKVAMGEDREEEIVKKWIAQGRVRRASLNWCNTFFKWILNLTVGRLWWYAVLHFIRHLLKFNSPRKIWDGTLVVIALNYVGSFISITPLAELIAFVIVPAYKQALFVAGTELMSQVFVTTVVRMFASWAVQTEFAQVAMRNMTETLKESKREARKYMAYKNEL